MARNRRVYLVRHGDIGLSEGRKHFIGQINLPLSERGIRQAQLLSQELKDISLSAIYCSTLIRSRETARIIADAHGLQPIVRDDLKEIHLGEWDGLAFDEVRERYPREFSERGRDIIHYRPPGGESFLQCSQRVIAALAEILGSTDGNLLIVGHSGPNRIILCHLLDIPLDKLFNIGQDLAGLSVILQRGSHYHLEQLNITMRYPLVA